ncbi:MAG: HDOD domain-containing protein [Acidobacteriota bacterium]
MNPKYRSLVDSLPKMSPLTMRMLRVLSKASCSIGELADIAERDAALSARILRTANSATFGRFQPVTSLRDAISIQGVGLLRKFIVGASITNLFSRTNTSRLFSILRFNLHSLATATLLELMTDEIPVENSDQAFVAGMLHDVGELLIALNCPSEHEQILALRAVSGDPQMECERKILGIDHAELSAMATTRWQLDDALTKVVANHHQAELQNGFGDLKLSIALERADGFVNSLGLSILPPNAESLAQFDLEFPEFALPKERLLKRFEGEWSKLNDLFQ